jgi:hypothetical protein
VSFVGLEFFFFAISFLRGLGIEFSLGLIQHDAFTIVQQRTHRVKCRNDVLLQGQGRFSLVQLEDCARRAAYA